MTSTTDDDGSTWLDQLRDWAESVSDTLITVGIISLGAFVLWVIGRLVIRGIVRGISSGIDWTEDQARGVLTKVRLSQVEQQSIQDQLADERRVARAHTIGQVLRAGLNLVILVIWVLTILSELGVSVAPILASAGIVGVALGFGAQTLVRDVLAGLFILLEDQYGVGDVVDVGEASGLVEEVGLRVTRLRSLDGTVWFVPNGEIRRVGNMSQLYSRVFIEVRFAYDTDIDAAREAMLEAAHMTREVKDLSSAIIGQPEVAGVESMDYQSVMLRLIMQVKPLTQWTLMRAIRQNMRDLFLERGIQLAAPEGSLIQTRKERKPQRPAAKTTPAPASRSAAKTRATTTKAPATKPAPKQR
jgi:small-conductance mechanosensitive channel